MADITILPTVDITAIDWTENGGPTEHWDCIDDDVSGSPDDTDFLDTTTIGHDFELSFAASPANLSECTNIALSFRGQIDDASATARLQVELDHTAGTPVEATKYITGTNFGGYSTLGNYTLQYATLTLDKTEVDSLQVEVIFLAS